MIAPGAWAAASLARPVPLLLCYGGFHIRQTGKPPRLHLRDVPEATSTDALQFTPIGKGIRPELVLPGLDDPHLAIRSRGLPNHVWLESWQHLLEVEGALLVNPHRLTTIPETHRVTRLGIVVVLDQPAAAYAVDLGTLGHHSVLVGLLECSPGAWMELAPCDPHDHSVPPSGCERECGPRARDAGALPPVCDGLMAPWSCLRHASTTPPHRPWPSGGTRGAWGACTCVHPACHPSPAVHLSRHRWEQIMRSRGQDKCQHRLRPRQGHVCPG